MINRFIQWSISNRWIVAILAFVWLAVGLYATETMPVDVFPDFAPIRVVVLTEAPGFAPEEVESLVTRPLEANLNGTANVKVVRSVSTIGLSVITIIFQDSTNVLVARQLVSEKLQAARGQLPDNVREPVLAPMTTAAGDILKIGLYSTGETSAMDLRTIADWTLRMRLMAVSGVSNVVVIGGDVKQYQVLVDPEKLKQYDVTLAQVVAAARGSNLNTAGGVVRTNEREELVRGLGRVSSPAEIADTVVVQRGSQPILLGNVADVKLGAQFKIGDAIVDGHPGIVLTVFKQPEANTLETTRALEKALDDLRPSFPKDVQVITTFRQADFIEIAVKNVSEAVVLGGVLVIIILFAFLQNWRTAVISLTAIPLSLLSAIIALKFHGYTINTMTLGGLAIAIGEVVDDAIIDVENIYRRLRENGSLAKPRPPLTVMYEASAEVRGAVVYATMIVALMFLPVLSLKGLEGKIFTPLAYAYLVSLIASLGVALTVTPAMCALLLKTTKGGAEGDGRVISFLKRMYLPLLQFSINRPRSIIAGALLLFVFSVGNLFVLGTEFLPPFDENNLIVVTTFMPGTSLTTTMQMGKELTSHFVGKHEILAASQRAGRAEGGEDYGASNFAEFDIRLRPDTPDKQKLLNHIRHEFSHVPGLVADSGSYLQHRMDHALSGVNAAIAVKVFGPDLDVLHENALKIEKVMKEIRGAVDVHVEQIVDVPQISIKVNREAAARYGVRVKDLSDSIEAAFRGVTVSQVLEGQKAFDMYVWLKPEYRNNLNVIKSTLVDTPANVKVPLGALASVSQGESPNTISHENISRRVVVQANVSGRDLGSLIAEAKQRIAKEVQLPTGYYVVYGGQFEAQEEASKQLGILLAAALVGMFLLLTLAFKSPKAAIIIMANLPLALVGGIWSVLFSGAVLSVGSMVGFMTLFGISTRNGIMLVSHFNQLTKEGGTLEDVVKHSALDRLSPVLMTALAASLGVLPIAVLGGAGRELEQPLAIVILGGMITSTALTLVVIPALLKLFGAGLSNSETGGESSQV